MTFQFDSVRNLFSGHKPEQKQPSFTPASGRDPEEIHDRLGSAENRQEATTRETSISSPAQDTQTEERRKDFSESEEKVAAVEWERQDKQETPEASESEVESNSHFVADIFIQQDKNIREEWQHDLQSGHYNQHDLETYFAGKIDQHNTMIDLAVKANPKLQETLAPQINYDQLRSELQQQIQQRQQASTQAMQMAI